MKQHMHFVFLVLIFSTIGLLATDIYLPSMPSMTHYFGTSKTMVQLTMPAFLLAFAFMPIIFGPYSDAVGRRKVIIGGLAVGLLATLVIIFATSIHQIIIARLFQGAGLGAVSVAARSMVPDRFHGPMMYKINSFTGTFFPVILAFAPILGGFIQQWFNWQTVFAFLFCYMSFVIYLAIFKLKETNTNLHPVDPKEKFNDYIALYKNHNFMVFGSIPIFFMIGMSAYLTASPYIFQNILGLSPSEHGSLSLIFGTVVFSGGLLNIKALDYFKPRTLILFSAGLMMFSGLFLLTLHIFDMVTISYVIIACFTFFFSINFAMPNSFASAFQYIKGGFGSATALISCHQMLSGFLSSSMISFLPEETILPLTCMFFLSGFMVALTLQFERRAL